MFDRQHVQTSWIHMGDEPFGGGNNNLLIQTGSIAQSYMQSDILEEVLAHEAVHTSLDAVHAGAPGWIAAQQADPEFISFYAREFPDREDIAESFVPWLAVRCAAEATDPDDILTIQETMPISRARDKKLCVVGLQANRELACFNERFEAVKFMPVLDSEFAFTDTDVRNAFHHFGAAAHKGKIVVRT